MIISVTRHADSLTYTDVLDMLGCAIRAYERTSDEELIPEIQRLNNWAEELKQKIQSKDYTEDDARERRVDEILKAYDKNK